MSLKYEPSSEPVGVGANEDVEDVEEAGVLVRRFLQEC